MPTYLVRMIDKHDLVGIFAAPNLMELAFLIDEALDPDLCEYQRISAGGIMWEKPAVAIPIGPSDAEQEHDKGSIPWANARFTEVWDLSIYGIGKSTRWTKIDLTLEDLYGIDPEAPEPEPPLRRPIKSEPAAKILPFRKRGT